MNSKESNAGDVCGTPQRIPDYLREIRPRRRLSREGGKENLYGTPRKSNSFTPRMHLTPLISRTQENLFSSSESSRGPSDKAVSLWPEMDTMRLTAEEGVWLALGCVTVAFSVFLIFQYLHGSLLFSMHRYMVVVSSFSAAYPIYYDSQHALNQTHATYLLYLLLYIGAIGTLLYYLADNVIQKSSLTPRRIKIWVLLLVATATWTLLVLRLLLWYQRLETVIEEAVRQFQDKLAHLAILDLDLRMYHNIATYWHSRCLPPLSRGTLSVFAVVPVRDVFFYLQYYSVPVLTALCTPILKLLLALKDMYIHPLKAPPQRPAPPQERPDSQNSASD
ncbi:hypothetical protein JZ751_006573 [Albula glossodonta]|uniref:Uncharacterized protein n=1 Tax=Albula glossodonta TaxID=121402 RepID=A0A8T2N496_9TELE|nr:hypothetical protein JZ751_006573 [Albula glossodonta]